MSGHQRRRGLDLVEPEVDDQFEPHLAGTGRELRQALQRRSGPVPACTEPGGIAKPRGGQAGTEQELLPGMILSNEPGYYRTGEYGIRIENLVLVEERRIEGAEGAWLGFETLTLAPIGRELVDRSLLDKGEIAWWNAYHARVLEVLGPQMEGEALAWLEAQCAPL